MTSYSYPSCNFQIIKLRRLLNCMTQSSARSKNNNNYNHQDSNNNNDTANDYCYDDYYGYLRNAGLASEYKRKRHEEQIMHDQISLAHQMLDEIKQRIGTFDDDNKNYGGNNSFHNDDYNNYNDGEKEALIQQLEMEVHDVCTYVTEMQMFHSKNNGTGSDNNDSNSSEEEPDLVHEIFFKKEQDEGEIYMESSSFFQHHDKNAHDCNLEEDEYDLNLSDDENNDDYETFDAKGKNDEYKENQHHSNSHTDINIRKSHPDNITSSPPPSSIAKPNIKLTKEELQKQQEEQLQQEISEMAAQLKQSTMNINTTLKNQNLDLDNVEVLAQQNLDKTKNVQEDVTEHVKKTGWRKNVGRWIVFFIILGSWIFCFLTIRVVPKRKNTCLFFCDYNERSNSRSGSGSKTSSDRRSSKQDRYYDTSAKKIYTFNDEDYYKDDDNYYDDEQVDLEEEKNDIYNHEDYYKDDDDYYDGGEVDHDDDDDIATGTTFKDPKYSYCENVRTENQQCTRPKEHDQYSHEMHNFDSVNKDRSEDFIDEIKMEQKEQRRLENLSKAMVEDEMIALKRVKDGWTNRNNFNDNNSNVWEITYTYQDAVFRAIDNDFTSLKDVLDKQPNLATATDENGWSILHEATRAGAVESVRLLLEVIDDNELLHSWIESVTLIAEERDYFNIVDLLRAYEDTKKSNAYENEDGNYGGKNDDKLGEIGGHAYSFQEAVYSAKNEPSWLLAILKEVPQYVNAFGSNGMTLLHEACVAGNVESVKILLKYLKNNVSEVNKRMVGNGGNAMWLAKKRGHDEIVKILEMRGGIELGPGVQGTVSDEVEVTTDTIADDTEKKATINGGETVAIEEVSPEDRKESYEQNVSLGFNDVDNEDKIKYLNNKDEDHIDNDATFDEDSTFVKGEVLPEHIQYNEKHAGLLMVMTQDHKDKGEQVEEYDDQEESEYNERNEEDDGEGVHNVNIENNDNENVQEEFIKNDDNGEEKSVDFFCSFEEAVDVVTNESTWLLEVLNAVPQYATAYGDNGMTLLHEACAAGNEESVRILVKHLNDVFEVNKRMVGNGGNAMWLAKKEGHDEIVNLLKAQGGVELAPEKDRDVSDSTRSLHASEEKSAQIEPEADIDKDIGIPREERPTSETDKSNSDDSDSTSSLNDAEKKLELDQEQDEDQQPESESDVHKDIGISSEETPASDTDKSSSVHSYSTSSLHDAEEKLELDQEQDEEPQTESGYHKDEDIGISFEEASYIAKNDASFLKEILSMAPQYAKAFGTNGMTLLHEASAAGNAESVKILLGYLDNDMNINTVMTSGAIQGNAMWLAKKGGHTKVVKLLERYGGKEVPEVESKVGTVFNEKNINDKSTNSNNKSIDESDQHYNIINNDNRNSNIIEEDIGISFEEASYIAKNDASFLKEILSMAPQYAKAFGTNGMTLLHEASAAGNTESVKILLGYLDNDMNINTVMASGAIRGNAMWLAKKGGHTKVVKLLERYGGKEVPKGEAVRKASQNKSKNESTNNDNKRNADSNKSKNDVWEDIGISFEETVYVAQNEAPLLLEILQVVPQYAKAFGSNGMTLLHEASAAGNVESVKILLDFLNDVTDINKRMKMNGGNAMWLAKKGGHDEIVNLLEAYGGKELSPNDYAEL